MHQKELHIVRFSMVVLFSALMIVYLLLYQIKGDDIVEQLSRIGQSNGINETQPPSQYSGIAGSLYTDGITNSGSEDLLIEESNNKQVDTGSNISKKSDSLFSDTNTGFNTGITNSNKINILSGTSLWYGRVESVEKLGISYQYALKDQKNIYYVFLDPERYGFDKIIKALGGTTYVLSTEKDIIENKLFGDKVTFINLPEYKDKKVIMLIEINKSLWLIQVDYSIYYGSKGYIKNLFIN